MTSVFEAVKLEVAAAAEWFPDLERCAEAALALNMAARVDSESTSATAAAMAAGRLLEALVALRGRMVQGRESPLDDIRARREARIAGGAKTADRVHPRRKATS